MVYWLEAPCGKDMVPGLNQGKLTTTALSTPSMRGTSRAKLLANMLHATRLPGLYTRLSVYSCTAWHASMIVHSVRETEIQPLVAFVLGGRQVMFFLFNAQSIPYLRTATATDRSAKHVTTRLEYSYLLMVT